mmetsp:Transcript_9318/g.15537  ORF Transcript_9318/g.15537 Transcript_9318/m.15537 type:complete len:98 (-) Transcript_9318:821-1114(-)
MNCMNCMNCMNELAGSGSEKTKRSTDSSSTFISISCRAASTKHQYLAGHLPYVCISFAGRPPFGSTIALHSLFEFTSFAATTNCFSKTAQGIIQQKG